MSQRDGLRSLDARIMRVLKPANLADVLATFEGSNGVIEGTEERPLDLLIDRGVTVQNADNTAYVSNQITIVALLAQILEVPSRGHRFTLGAELFIVDRVLDKDESHVICLVKLQS